MANIKIRARHSAVARLVRPRPAEGGAFEAFISDADGFQAYVHRDVLDLIKQQAERAGDNETIGLLMGRICHDPKSGPYTLIMAADGALDGEFEATASHVKLSAQGHAKVRHRLEAAHPDREIVGWYHTHPHYPPRFSSVDTSEQATWSDADHIGIVYSGIDVDEPFGVYRGPHAKLLRQARPVQKDNSPAPERQSPPPHTPRAESPVLTGDSAATPLPARQKKLEKALFYTLALLLAVTTGGLFWLHRRVSAIERKLNTVVVAQADNYIRDETHEQPAPGPPPVSTATASLSTSATLPPAEVTLMYEPEVRPPAKPLTPEATPRPKPSRDRDASSLRREQRHNFKKKNQQRNRSRNSRTLRRDDRSKETPTRPQSAVPQTSQSPPRR